jgi:23S rRNA (cytidine1920-2'-O)/16S rRNA (cytidine1409-2'-O)-methyltransferase
MENFSLDFKGKRCIDIGSSTGGFTDCLLKNGAVSVIAVDSGTNQLVPELRFDERIYVKENFNARYMKPEDLPYAPELCVMDVSFISATHIIPAVYNCLIPHGEFVLLIKPQFEVGRSGLGKGGIVKDDKVRDRAVESVVKFAEEIGFITLGLIKSSILGGDGNIEFLAYFRKKEEIVKVDL